MEEAGTYNCAEVFTSLKVEDSHDGGFSALHVIDDKNMQLLNAKSAIDVTLLPKIKFVRFEQFTNAPNLIYLTLSFITTLVKPVHP